jgi:hypothetical protein
MPPTSSSAGKIVLVWDNSTQHKDTLMRELLAAREQWLSVFRLRPGPESGGRRVGET